MRSTIEIKGQTCICNSAEKTELMRLFVNHPTRCFMIEEIADEAGLAPERIKDVLDALRAERLRFDQLSVLGVLYQPDESRLHPDMIGARLSTQWWGKRIYFGDEFTSTIDIAKALPDDANLHGSLVVANMQTQGRGRHGSHWISRKGKDILLTFVLKAGGWHPSPSLLSLYASIAVARVLDTAYQLPIQIKWPNDLFMQNRKVGGVMVEQDESRDCYMVSLGLNVHSRYSDWPDECRETAISLSLEKGFEWQRDLLIAQCGNTWEFLWDLMQRDQGETIRNYWNQYSGTLNKTVCLQLQGKEMTGIVKELNADGLLILEDRSGSIFELIPEHVKLLRVVE